MLFQVLCGFEPIFYTTHPNEEPVFAMNINMDNNTAKEIITKYIFANYDMDVLNRYLNINN